MAKAVLKEERTFMMVKPDGVRRGLTGEIIRRIEQRGLKIVACSLNTVKRNEADKHYPKDAKWIRRLGEKTMAVHTKHNLNPKKEMGTDDLEKMGAHCARMAFRLFNIWTSFKNGYRRCTCNRYGT